MCDTVHMSTLMTKVTHYIFVIQVDGQSERPRIECLTWSESIFKCGLSGRFNLSIVPHRCELKQMR